MCERIISYLAYLLPGALSIHIFWVFFFSCFLLHHAFCARNICVCNFHSLTFAILRFCDINKNIETDRRGRGRVKMLFFLHRSRFRVRKYLHIWFRFEGTNISTTDTGSNMPPTKRTNRNLGWLCWGVAIMHKLKSERNRLVVTMRKSKE